LHVENARRYQIGIRFGSEPDRDDLVGPEQVPLCVGNVQFDLIAVAPFQEPIVEKELTGKKRRWPSG